MRSPIRTGAGPGTPAGKPRFPAACLFANNPDYFVRRCKTECIAFTPENYLTRKQEVVGLAYVLWYEK